MSNIFTESIGRKLVMSISGLFLILFLTVHASVNSLYLFSREAFQAGCDFMKLPIITAIVPVLAFGFLVHIVYAFILYIQDYKARGPVRYAVANKSQSDGWASRNMIILGLLILIGIGLHLTDFWAKMQLQEFMGNESANGPESLEFTFGNLWIYILYILWFVCLWLHLNHGFWSAFQTIGWNNNKWLPRLRVIGIIYSSLIVLIFIAVATKAFLYSHWIIC